MIGSGAAVVFVGLLLLGCEATAAALGGAARGMNEGLNNEPPQPTPRCSNDYQCGYGNYCVKQQFQSTGTCARVVDDYGTPTYAPPRGESYAPGGEGECSYDTECAYGFHCIKGSALKGHCMK